MDPPNQYYTLNLGTIEIKHSRQSLYRHWNRLTRFQKTLGLLLFMFLAFYVLTHIEFHRVNKNKQQQVQGHFHEPIHPRQPLPNVVGNSGKQERSTQPENSVLRKAHNRTIRFSGPTNERQRKVRDAFVHAWKGYKEHAWGEDELRPISKTSSSWFNLGLTIVDSLDTIYIMNLEEQFAEATAWVRTRLNLDSNRYNNLFEITIRILGGLMSAYHLSGERLFLDKAYDLGNRSLVAFNTRSAIPYSDINLANRRAKPPSWTSDSSISEAATVQLEFKDLSYQTGDARFFDACEKTNVVIHRLPKDNGLVPIFINTETGKFTGSTVTLGARGDSYYEYLLKQWIQNGAVYDKSDDHYYLLDDWLTAVQGIRTKLARQTRPHNYTYVGELLSGTFSAKMDHLVCFLPGNVALGAMYLGRNADYPRAHLAELMQFADELTETCWQMYAQMETGLSPEIAYFNSYEGATSDLYVKEADRHNLLRPETVESFYYMYKITNNTKYQEYGWKVFEAFEQYTRVDAGGYTSIGDVTNARNVKPKDKMESFFLAETLKYFYLLFEDNSSKSIDLNQWVINTEAHMFPIYYKR